MNHQNRENLKLLISERLCFLRRSMGLRQEQVAEYLGVERTTYTAWECGRNCPDALSLKLIVVDLLGYSLDDFLDLKTPIEKKKKKKGKKRK